MKRNNKKNKHRLITKGKGNEPTVIEFNLSKAVILLISIVSIIVTITTVKVITTIIETKQNNTLANEEENNENVTWVESTHIDDNGSTVKDVDGEGNVIKIPVPKGYTASKIPGETSANSGFVIYEGDIDWSTILVDSTSDMTTSTQSETNEEINTNEIMTSNEENVTLVETEEIQETENTENTENTDNAEDTENTENTEDTDNTENTDNTSNIEINSNNEESKVEENIQDLDTQIEENLEETLTEETTYMENTNIETRATAQEINIFNLQKSVNQYVWVPVNDISRIYGVDSNEKLWGKLYNFPKSGERTPLYWTENNGIMNINNASNREPDVVPTFFYDGTFYFYGDMDSSLYTSLDGMTKYELLSKELEETFYITIKSIEQYGGFYIGRYETGMLNGTAVVRKMNTNITELWEAMYMRCQELKAENNHVITSMIWGSLWDETLQWLVESGATTSDGTILTYDLIANDSSTWGNYLNSTFYYIPSESETPEATEEKKSSTHFSGGVIIPTGSSDYTKVNNIYDLAGNVAEYTLEVEKIYDEKNDENEDISDAYRITRGSEYERDNAKATYRMGSFNYSGGSRSILLIK